MFINTRPYQKELRSKGKKKDLKDPFKLKRIKKEDNGITGIYFLFNLDEVVYIGQSKNINSRIAQHISENEKEFDCFSFITCNKNQLNKLEEKYIFHHSPLYNKTLTKQHQVKKLRRLKRY
jgi:excinuclease UvrABC nuclease subunit